MKTIDEYIATLTPEEREKHKELIEECKKREKEILKNAQRTEMLFQRLKKINKEFYEELQKLHKKIINLNKINQITLEKAANIILMLKKDNDKRFYM